MRLPCSFYIDTQSGQLYGDMPEIIRCGTFEIAYLGGFLTTRTQRCYRVKGRPEYLMLSRNGLYLPLSHFGTPADEIVDRMVVRYPVFQVCQLKGDDSQVYWLLSVFKDDSVLVMDDQGTHYHVWMDWQTGEVAWKELGPARNEAERALMTLALNEIAMEAVDREREKKAMVKRAAERMRMREMGAIVSAEPFRIGDKWGLRDKGRIIVPPMYRMVLSPVGRYCAFELSPRQWGVLAIDGKVEVPARYERVELFPDGRAELTVYSGKLITKQLGT